MNKYKNITHYHNHLSEKLNSIEEFFTQLVIDFLKEIPDSYRMNWDFNSFESGYLDVGVSFEFDDEEKWNGVNIKVTFRYVASIDSNSFLDFCDVRVKLLKQNWWEQTDDEDTVTYFFGDFPTDLIPLNIISKFKPVFSFPSEFNKIAFLYKTIDYLRKAEGYIKDKAQMRIMISDLESEIIELKRNTRNFPMELFIK